MTIPIPIYSFRDTPSPGDTHHLRASCYTFLQRPSLSCNPIANFDRQTKKLTCIVSPKRSLRRCPNQEETRTPPESLSRRHLHLH